MAEARLLVAGASGYIGGHLSRRLATDAQERKGSLAVRCLVRHAKKGQQLAEMGADVVVGDVLDPASLEQALEGVDVAYYLVHSMGRGGEGDFAELDRRGAGNFADAARQAGVERIVYLGGLGEGRSAHLRSRHETAGILAETGVPVTYLRAAVVVGGGSESFLTIYHLTRRLPVMVTPKWTSTRTQPIAIADVVDYLVAAGLKPEARGRKVEIGGPEVTTYGGMMDALADAMDRRRPLRVTVPFLTPWLSSLWIGLVTPVDAGVARPLIEGLSTETVVTDPSGMELFSIQPRPLAVAMREALNELEHPGPG